jgi:hypothetical protein
MQGDANHAIWPRAGIDDHGWRWSTFLLCYGGNGLACIDLLGGVLVLFRKDGRAKLVIGSNEGGSRSPMASAEASNVVLVR